MVHICKYCNSIFTAKYNLTRHQKSAKKCLEARGEETLEFECICGKSFTRADNLLFHQRTCTLLNVDTHDEPKEELAVKVIDDYKDMVKDLQKQILELSSRPTKVNNTTNVLNSLQPITDKDFQDNVDKLELEYILDGARGYANYAKCYPLKDNVICTDKARKKIKYKNEHGEITDDSRLLAQRFFQAISERNKDLLNNEYRHIHEEVQEIVADNRSGVSDITGLLTKATFIQNMLIKSERAATGDDDEFTREFLNHLAKII